MVDQELAKTVTEIASKINRITTSSLSTETTLDGLAASIVADAKAFPARYLRRCVTGHDGE